MKGRPPCLYLWEADTRRPMTFPIVGKTSLEKAPWKNLVGNIFSPFSNRWKFLGLAVLLLAAAPLQAQTYRVTGLGTLGGAGSRAYGLNAAGAVVGEAERSDGVLRAFLWTRNGGMRDLCGDQTGLSRAYALNDRGVVVGEMENADGLTVPFRWSEAEGLAPLPLPPGSREGYAYAVNNFNVIGGACEMPDGVRPVIWTVDGPALVGEAAEGGAIHAINDLGDIGGQAEASEERAGRGFLRNAAGWRGGLGPDGALFSSAVLALAAGGDAAGYAEQATATHAMLFPADGGWRDLDTLDSVYSVAFGLNRAGTAVGQFVASHEDEDRAFVVRDGAMFDLNEWSESADPWLLVEARAVNEAGQIAGYGLRGTREEAYLLDPLEGGASARPVVRWIAPPADTVVPEGGTMELEAAADAPDAVKRVVFYANGDVLGMATNPPFRYVWAGAKAGFYDLVAVAIDRHGYVQRSARRRATVALPPGRGPAVILLEPDDGTALALGDPVRVLAEARGSDLEPVSVTLWLDGTSVTNVTGSTAETAWNPATTGLFVWTATALDPTGRSTTSDPVRINVTD